MKPRKLSNKLKPTNTGPMKTSIQGNTADQDVENRQPQPPNLQPVAETSWELLEKKAPAKSQQDSSPVPHDTLDKKEKGPHAIHSFVWCWNDKNPTNTTCNIAGTIEGSLMRHSSQFREIAGKNRNKELVILRDGKAISSHFPCSLIKNERLIVKYFKAVDKPQQQVSGHRQRKRPSGKLVTFHILTKGGRSVKNIMRYSAFKTVIQEITVYAYKGEKVKQALKRDGRLRETIFIKNCGLLDTSTEVTTEMSNLVDDLHGKTFRIILLNKSVQPESLHGSLDDATISESQRSEADTSFLNSKELEILKSLKFIDEVKRKRTQQGSKPSQFQNLFRVDYRNSTQTYNKVGTWKTLMDRSNSVCQVRINGNALGSGFLLFGKFVLTNAHVVKGIFDKDTWQLLEKVTVHFCFESLGQMDSGIAVEEVAGFDCPVPGQLTDWALLRLSADQEVPDGLLTRFGFLPQSGRIYIVGHPSGESKGIDPCLIVPNECRMQVVEKHYYENPEGVFRENFQYLTQNFFKDAAQFFYFNKQLLTYESDFYHGSSGSPVFDECGNVVAMHSGGYVYQNATGQRKSVMEFGYPLSGIIERILVQVVQRGRFDVLKEYLAYDFAQSQNVMDNLKKLVESRTAFEEVLNIPLVSGDESLRRFFEFLLEPVPMEIDMA